MEGFTIELCATLKCGFALRHWRVDDAVSLQSHANDRDIWINMCDAFPHPYTLQDAHDWIELARSEPVTNWVITADDEAVGGIGLKLQSGNRRRSAEIGYWLGKKYWGHGIATLALTAATEQLFAQTDLRRLFARVYEWNPRSARVLEKAGYRYEGRHRRSVLKDGELIDELVYAAVKR